MRSLFSYFLTLLCGLTLALPPGWCCIFLPAPAEAEERKPSGTAPDCCSGDTEQPAPAPADKDAPSCPCSERNTPLPSYQPSPADELPAVIALLPAAGVSVPVPGSIAPPDLSVRPYFRSLCVLQCVWRC
jgi:hypothetical protein